MLLFDTTKVRRQNAEGGNEIRRMSAKIRTDAPKHEIRKEYNR